jgi:hypothetical protein
MTVNVKAQAETPFSPCGRRVRGSAKRHDDSIIGASATVKAAPKPTSRGCQRRDFAEQPVKPDAGERGERQKQRRAELEERKIGGENGADMRKSGLQPRTRDSTMNAPKYPSKTPSPDGSGLHVGRRQIGAGRRRDLPHLARRGLRVAPFKPQNMALNSAVTIDGGEIGRAQALQALAAGVPPHIDFNPILLKPSTDKRAQVIIHGKALDADLNARDYHEYKPRAMKAVLESWERLCALYDCIVVEGAGSPAEINLRAATSPTWALPKSSIAR